MPSCNGIREARGPQRQGGPPHSTRHAGRFAPHPPRPADEGGDPSGMADAADRAGRKKKSVQSLDREGRWLLKKFEELNVSKETIQPLIMGRDLIKMGVSPGPLMGKYLKKLYHMQLDNEFDTKEKGLILAKKLVKKGNP